MNAGAVAWNPTFLCQNRPAVRRPASLPRGGAVSSPMALCHPWVALGRHQLQDPSRTPGAGEASRRRNKRAAPMRQASAAATTRASRVARLPVGSSKGLRRLSSDRSPGCTGRRLWSSHSFVSPPYPLCPSCLLPGPPNAACFAPLPQASSRPFGLHHGLRRLHLWLGPRAVHADFIRGWTVRLAGAAHA